MAILLRGGHTTRDRRLDRLPQPDPRNQRYPIRGLFAQLPTLRSYTWTVGAHLNQGEQGHCVGYGFAHDVIARPLPHLGLGQDFAEQTYQQAIRLDEWPGEDYEGTSVLAGAKALTGQGWYAAYHWAQTEEDVALAVGYHGPVIVGVDWWTGMFDADEEGFLNVTGQVEGGHCTLIHSFDKRRGFYRIWNSWSASWGQNGTAKIRRDDLAELLTNGGEACLPVRAR